MIQPTPSANTKICICERIQLSLPRIGAGWMNPIHLHQNAGPGLPTAFLAPLGRGREPTSSPELLVPEYTDRSFRTMTTKIPAHPKERDGFPTMLGKPILSKDPFFAGRIWGSHPSVPHRHFRKLERYWENLDDRRRDVGVFWYLNTDSTKLDLHSWSCLWMQGKAEEKHRLEDRNSSKTLPAPKSGQAGMLGCALFSCAHDDFDPCLVPWRNHGLIPWF